MRVLPEPLRTGISLVDQEHGYLIDLLDRLHRICPRPDSVCDGCEPAKATHCENDLGTLFVELLEFMVEHFRHEEDLMRTLGLPRNVRELHAEAHADIAQRIRALIDPNPDNFAIKPAEFRQTVMAWLEDHIKNWDMQITRQGGNHPG
jgi:hemerythrin-like metal-binding protein